ncbi:MAG: DUF2125 domain-containing protein [Bradyrhizobiaceae bacterium]|nr:MAG: DUF2125 domain-containing protein [Bradyrhizobiaceae bacterium]
MNPLPLEPRHRRWPIFVAPALFFMLAALWSAFWFYAASQVDEKFDGWRMREAKSGRTYECSERGVAGFPFRLEVRCEKPVISLTGQTAAQLASHVPLTARLEEILAVTQVYDPTRVIAEFKGPVTVAESGQPAFAVANWSLGHASAGGLPSIPQRVSMEFNDPAIDLVNSGGQSPLVRAKHVEWHLRVVDGTTSDSPVIETVFQTNAASVQGFHPLLADPFDADIRAQLRGLKDFSPKSWPARFREIQQAGGRIDFSQSRVQQGDTIVVASGSLGLTPTGYLEGELQTTIAGFERLVPALGIDKLLEENAQTSPDRPPSVNAQDVNKVIGALDRMIPGLGNVVRKNANAGVIAGINLLGQQTTLEDRPARSFKLKFVDGAIVLGPLRVAQTPALF